MRHLGDITLIKGNEAPTVDCIIGGSPCQDLSLAGKRAGLAGARSGLYMEQIRIIKEMRENDRVNGRTGVDVRPRYMVWENVPGAFSTNKGQDFTAVLEEAIRVAEPEAPNVSVPEKGWPTAGCIVGDCWSVAWRVLDAQFWGTSDKPLPQRRRRIALVADFGGLSAPEVLFVRKSVSGDIEPGKPKGKEAPGDAGESSGGAVPCTLKIRGGCAGVGKGALIQEDKSATLSTLQDQTLFQPVLSLQGSMIGRADQNGPQGDGVNEDVSFTLNTTDRHAVAYGIGSYHSNAWKSDNPNSGVYEDDTAKTLDSLNCGYPGCNQGGMAVVQPMAYSIENHPADSRVDIDETGKVQTLTSRMGTGGGNVPMVMETFHATVYENVSPPLKARYYKDPHIVAGVDCRNGTELPEQNINLQSSCCHNLNSGNVVRVKHIVRRLTPLECERLQGFPDGWTLIGDPVEEEIADYAYIYDESKYIAPNPADFGLTEDDLNDYAPVDDEDSLDDEDAYDDNYLEYLNACAKARSKATKRVKVGSHMETNYYYTDSNGKRKKVSDSARYKALGNSIALPPWKWVLKRLCACYERDATMASLFDGIGGFPLIWEQLNGKRSCLWASEIEEFLIAVTKARFGE